jgi:hypothetical protein
LVDKKGISGILKGVAINIKNERTVAAVKRLAAHYGVSYTAAIEIAAETALRQPNPTAEEQALSQVEQITTAYRAHLDGATALDEGGLYDDVGLYR